MSDAKKNSGWSQDKLKREKYWPVLTKILTSQNKPFVVSIEAQYGGGKSFFIENWQRSLGENDHKIPTVYFDAWLTDFAQDPVLAFLSQVKKDLKPYLPIADEKEFIKKLGNGIQIITRHSVPAALKFLTQKTIGDEATEELKGAASEIIHGVATDILNEYDEDLETIGTFKQNLKQIADEIFTTNTDLKSKKIIVFIDELDRCRPTYAIELLECIKHFFAVEGFIFVLAMDMNSIESAIKSVYGAGIDAPKYIQKFLDWRFELPAPDRVVYAAYLLEQSGIYDFDTLSDTDSFLNGKTDMAKTFAAAADLCDLNLREMDRRMTEIEVALRSLDTCQIPYPCLTILVACIRHSFPELSEKIRASSDHSLKLGSEADDLAVDKKYLIDDLLFLGATTNPSRLKDARREILDLKTSSAQKRYPSQMNRKYNERYVDPDYEKFYDRFLKFSQKTIQELNDKNLRVSPNQSVFDYLTLTGELLQGNE